MLFPLLGYFFCMITVLTTVVVLMTGFSNISTFGNGRHYPRPVIARTVTVETQRHSPVAKEASPAKDVSPPVVATVSASSKSDLSHGGARKPQSNRRALALRRCLLQRRGRNPHRRNQPGQHGKHTQSAPAWGYAFGAMPTLFSIMSAWSPSLPGSRMRRSRTLRHQVAVVKQKSSAQLVILLSAGRK